MHGLHAYPAEPGATAGVQPSATFIVADDHPLFRAALREAIARVMPSARVLEAGTLSKLDELATEHADTTDLILLDLRMPGAHGLSELVRLRALYPTTPVAIISAAENPATVRKAMTLGASGFIPKAATIETIGAMLRALLAGQMAFPRDLPAQSPAAGPSDRELARDASTLTAQQFRVLVCLARGDSNRAIAQALGVSEATIKAHVTVILRKLKLERRTQAALVGQRLFGTEPGEAAIDSDNDEDA